MVAGANAQTQPDWRRIGNSSIELRLASPVTGPVDRVWFSPDGGILYARTHSGSAFQTSDFEGWAPAVGVPDPPPLVPAPAVRLPEPGARVVAAPGNSARMYAMARHLSRSEDGGRAWQNLTAYRSEPVIGAGQHDVAVSPANQDELVVANDFGVWRSMDGGLSWSGLNQFLPNLAVSRILSTPSGAAGTRVQVGTTVLELLPGASTWYPVPGLGMLPEIATLRGYGQALGADIRAYGRSIDTVYAGSSDGRIWKSVDGGATFQATRLPQGATGPVERVFVDPTEPRVALAVLSGNGAHVLRTVNGGIFWDVLDANLPNAPVYGVTAERTAGAVYIAGEKGVYYAHADLENAGPTTDVNWVSLSDDLPAARPADVRLDAAGVQLYVALDGYGVYAAAAPHRRRSVRLVNAADYSTRPAAPGSLVSVVGARVTSARGGNLDYPVFATPAFAASDSESQIQVPFEAVGPDVALLLRTPAEQFLRHLPVQPVSPAILVPLDGVPAFFDADSGMPLEANAAHPNQRIQIMGTGLGKVRPDWPTGREAPLTNPPEVAAAIRAYLDRSPVQVTRTTLWPGSIGFYLIEVQLPALTNFGSAELYITADGLESNHVPIVIEP